MNAEAQLPQYVVQNGFIQDRTTNKRILSVDKVIKSIPFETLKKVLQPSPVVDQLVLSYMKECPLSLLNPLLDDYFSTVEVPVDLLLSTVTKQISEMQLSSTLSDEAIADEFLIRVKEFKKAKPSEQDVNVFNTAVLAKQQLLLDMQGAKNDNAIDDENASQKKKPKLGTDKKKPDPNSSNEQIADDRLQKYLLSVGVTNIPSHVAWMKEYEKSLGQENFPTDPFANLTEMPPACSRYYIAFDFLEGETDKLDMQLSPVTLQQMKFLQERANIALPPSQLASEKTCMDHAEFVKKLFFDDTHESSTINVTQATLNFCNLIDAHNCVCGGWSELEIKKHLVPMHLRYLIAIQNDPSFHSPLTFRLCWKHY